LTTIRNKLLRLELTKSIQKSTQRYYGESNKGRGDSKMDEKES